MLLVYIVKTQQALAEVEDLVIQLRGLGWRDIEILSIQGEGGSANSTQALQETIRLLNSSKDMRHIQTLADNLRGAGSTINTTVTRSGGPDQSLATPRAMSVRDTAVPHQFGLTPFSGHTGKKFSCYLLLHSHVPRSACSSVYIQSNL